MIGRAAARNSGRRGSTTTSPSSPNSRSTSALNASLKTFAEAARRVDASLPQMVESARGKVDFQFARLEEGVAAKARHRLELKHPAWVRIRYALLPGEKLQERRIASLLPVAFRGRAVVRELCELAASHARRLAEGSHEHYLLEL